MLTEEESTRYNRQIIMEAFGEEGQEKLRKSRVVIAGAGGLGSPVATYLAAAGIGHIRIIDRDKVELSNLNRQILHWEENVGQPKTDSAINKLNRLNHSVTIEGVQETINQDNAAQLIAGFDAVVDALDNLPSKHLLNKVALEQCIPFFHGAVYGLEGRAMTVIPGRTACLRCLQKGAIPGNNFPVIGVTPGVIGCLQAAEVIKYITGIGELLTDRYLIFNGLSMKFTEMEISRDPDCEHCGYE
ncbi:ThiF family adenylyltransferase [Chloroflexota bacterium]